jgi:hypothetical protein
MRQEVEAGTHKMLICVMNSVGTNPRSIIPIIRRRHIKGRYTCPWIQVSLYSPSARHPYHPTNTLSPTQHMGIPPALIRGNKNLPLAPTPRNQHPQNPNLDLSPRDPPPHQHLNPFRQLPWPSLRLSHRIRMGTGVYSFPGATGESVEVD